MPDTKAKFCEKGERAQRNKNLQENDENFDLGEQDLCVLTLK